MRVAVGHIGELSQRVHAGDTAVQAGGASRHAHLVLRHGDAFVSRHRRRVHRHDQPEPIRHQGRVQDAVFAQRH